MYIYIVQLSERKTKVVYPKTVYDIKMLSSMINQLFNTVLILAIIAVINGQKTNNSSVENEYNGILPRYTSDENDCEKYKLFVNSEWVEFRCPISMKWSQSLSQCVKYNPEEDQCSPSNQLLQGSNLSLEQIVRSAIQQKLIESPNIDVSVTE